jgi:hypothetical protein
LFSTSSFFFNLFEEFSMSFDQANLAIVAYAQVSGANGSSTLCNSGVVTTKISAGYYSITLPSGLQQPSANDIVSVTPTSTLMPLTEETRDFVSVVNNTNSTTKYVLTSSNGTGVDCDFSVVIMRSLLSSVPC